MNKPLIVIVGQTASGKTDLAFELAKAINGQIINGDSWSIRKRLDIGTDKPSLQQRKIIKHYLIDVIDPDKKFSVSEYKNLAVKTIKKIQDIGKVPILVGGSGLYIDSIIFNYSFATKGDDKQREKLNRLSLEELLRIIHSKNIKISEEDKKNKRRIIRTIETNGKKGIKSKISKNILIIGIKRSKEDLKEKITKRVNQMITKGLEKEVYDLYLDYKENSELFKGVGYGEWIEYFKHKQDLDRTRELIIKHTLRLAKKQETWFKRNNSVHWYQQPIEKESIVDLVTTFIQS